MLARAAAWRPRAAAAALSSSPSSSWPGGVWRYVAASAPEEASAPSASASASASSSSSPGLAPAPTTIPYYALDDDQRAFQQLAADFAREKLLPHSSDWDARSYFPVDVFREAAALGFGGGMFVPEPLGGSGLSRLSASVVFEELASGDIAFSTYVSIHNMVAGVVAKHAASDAARFAAQGQERELHERRRAALLKRLCSMESFAAYCLTEPSSGSDAASLSTSARRGTCPATGEPGWLLRGSKAFISGAGVADVYLVMARVAGGGQGAEGITAFLLDRRREGHAPASLTFGAPEKKMGWKMQPTCAVHLDDAFVPDYGVVGPVGGGFREVALRALDGGRVNIGAASVGGAARALAAAARYARSRRQFGVRVSDFQATRMRLADAATDVEAARLLVRRAAAALDVAAAAAAAAGGEGGAGGDNTNTSSPCSLDDEASALAAMAKRFASDKCFDAANAALQTFGGYGFLSDYGVEQAVRDLRVHSLLEGTNEVMRLVVAKKLPLFVDAAAAEAE
jgi:alkylation response protein AidB-like acyl-CoA dehydrogenase